MTASNDKNTLEPQGIDVPEDLFDADLAPIEAQIRIVIWQPSRIKITVDGDTVIDKEQLTKTETFGVRGRRVDVWIKDTQHMHSRIDLIIGGKVKHSVGSEGWHGPHMTYKSYYNLANFR